MPEPEPPQLAGQLGAAIARAQVAYAKKTGKHVDREFIGELMGEILEVI